MRADREKKIRLTVDNLEDGFNHGVKHAVVAIVLVATASFFLLIFGFFRVVPFGQALLWVYAIANALSFALVAWDKVKARANKWRISEGTLHFLEALGGFFGSFLAQQLFRHKTRSKAYQVAFWTIVVIHFGGWALWFTHGVDWMQRMQERHRVDRHSISHPGPASPHMNLEKKTDESESRPSQGAFRWGQRHWLLWFLPYAVLLPVPLVASAYERIWRRQFREKKRTEMAGRPPPSDAEIADWRTRYRWRHLAGVAVLLGKPFLVLLMMAMVMGTGLICVWIWNASDYSPMSLVLGGIVLLVVLPFVQLFYHAACEQLESLNVDRLIATGREDVSRMIGIQLRMDDATDVAKDYINNSPGDRIYQVVSIVGWPSLTLIGIAALFQFFGVIDLATLFGNWGVPATLTLYGIMSVYAFVKMKRDKRDALQPAMARSVNPEAEKRRRQLLRESELHCLEMLGGFAGSFIAQHLLRHKTEKFAYQYVFWTIVIFHLLAWVVLVGALEPIPLAKP